MPSEVPTAPGNDARAGAARAAALRALALADDEVTAQRDVSVLNRLRELKDLAVDDLDEDTSVLPGLTIKEATAAAVAAKKAAEAQEESRRPTSRQPVEAQQEESRRATSRQPAAGPSVAARFAAAEDDRPTPADPDSELSATLPPDTAGNLTADRGRYSAIDALWVTSDAANGPSSRGRSLTVQNPAAALEAAAADAAAAAAHGPPHRGGPVARAPEPQPAPVASAPIASFLSIGCGMLM